MIIVDYKIGNIGSILNMLKRIGVKAKFSSDPDEIMAASHILLPGVGAFDNGMKHLHQSGLIETLNHKALIEKTPILGICLGMQLLLEGSEEGTAAGLGWIKGRSKKFDMSITKENLKIPHMGWNTAIPHKEDTLFSGLGDDARFYFVHSYHALCADPGDVAALTHHGYEFCSAVQRGNIFGMQFHPEKSHKFGMHVLKKFVELPSC